MSDNRKVAIITGGSRGIGAGLVNALREHNFRVVATYRSINQGGCLNKTPARGGCQVNTVTAQVRD